MIRIENLKPDDFLKVIIAGVAGTAAMTCFINYIANRANHNMKVVPVLGTMLTDATTEKGNTSRKPKVYLAGTLSHYMVGMGFSITYLFLWNHKIINLTLKMLYLPAL
jgi:hypothetical protein